MGNEDQNLATVTAESPRPALDAEMYACALCVEGLEPLKADPRSLGRVLHFITSRYLDGLITRRDEIDAEIKAVQEKAARQKYGVEDETLVEFMDASGMVTFSAPWNSIQAQAAFNSGATVRKAQLSSARNGDTNAGLGGEVK